MENVTFLLRGGDYFELQEFIRSPRHVLEPKNGKVEPRMDHFDDFQEKDGYESTKTQFLDAKVFSELYPVETNGINDLLRKLGVGNFGEIQFFERPKADYPSHMN